ncbi:MAG TPA: MOSC domain-containing protein [Ferruginibacter sp.]|nr:MOSC domain-containing protein [Ferruginibacter sp.]
MLTVSQLYIYPIKSLGGISVSEVNSTDRGFEYDRRWMLIDEHNNFLTQREFPAMALLQPALTSDGLRVVGTKQDSDFILIPFTPATNDRIATNIWGVPCTPLHVSDEADKWFSEQLQTQCRLVYMDDDTQVLISESYNINNSLTSFSDGFPILMISEASLDDLNSRASEVLPMNRFRPNLVINGAGAFEEDRMKEFMINGVVYYGAKPSARCMITTIDQSSGAKGKEPLMTLSKYRSLNNKIYFGENVIASSTGIIHVGDELTILKTKETIFQP